MSTYLHETIHWWQHIGSTYGFIYSLNYPVQSHCTHFALKNLVKGDGFKKSVFLQATALNERGPTGFGTLAGIANTIINNHFDLFAFRAFTLGPIAAKDVVERNLFENVGHAFHMTYGHTVGILASTVDRDFQTLPHPEKWADGFRDLKDRKVTGYFYGSHIDIWPVGSYELFEGQARFSQIQYLSFACGHRLDWDDFRNLGLLDGVYVKAFEGFLKHHLHFLGKGIPRCRPRRKFDEMQKPRIGIAARRKVSFGLSLPDTGVLARSCHAAFAGKTV